MSLRNTDKPLFLATANVGSIALKCLLRHLLVKMSALFSLPHEDGWPPFVHTNVQIPHGHRVTQDFLLHPHILTLHFFFQEAFGPSWSLKPDPQSAVEQTLFNFPRN